MQIEQQKTDKAGEIQLTVTVPAEDVRAAEEKAFRQLSTKLKLSGFRRGKVPEAIARKSISVGDIRAAMLDDALPQWYVAALEEKKLKAIAVPKIELTSAEEGKPLTFTAKVVVYPDVKLADYQKVKAQPKAVKVTQADIDNALDTLRQDHVRYEEKAAAAKDGFVVVMNVSAKLGEEAVKAFTREKYELYLGDGYFAPGFDEHIRGMKAGDTKTFVLKFPADYPLARFKDQELTFTVDVSAVKERILPEVDDTFAVKVGAKDVADLQHKVKHSLEHLKAEQAERDFHNEVLETLAKDTHFDLPELLVEDELKKMQNEFEWRLKQQGFSLDQFLTSKKQKLEDLQKEWRPHAEKVARQDVVIDQISVAEKIAVTEEEIAHELTAWLQPYRDSRGQLNKNGLEAKRSLQSENGQLYLRQLIRREKTRRFLFDLVKKNAAPAAPVDKDKATPAK